MIMNCIAMSMRKTQSIKRLARKSPSLHRSSGICINPTSTGVKIAVKTSATDVTMSQLRMMFDVRGSIRNHFLTLACCSRLRILSW